MSILSGITSLAKVAANSPKLIKGAKGVYCLMEVTEVAIDSYILGDEIAKAIMGDDHDPEVKALAQKVSEAGIQYDRYIQDIAIANSDIDNLYNSVNNISRINADFGDKQELVYAQLGKLEQLNTFLLNHVPTAYTAFAAIGANAANTSGYSPQKLQEIRNLVGVNYLEIGIVSSVLSLKAGAFAYGKYQKRVSAGTPAKTSNSKMSRADISQGVSPSEVSTNKAELAKKAKRRTTLTNSRIGMLKTSVGHILNVGTFAMAVYSLVQRQHHRDHAIEQLNDMLHQYEADNIFYQQALDGVPENNTSALSDYIKHFKLDSEKETWDTCGRGYNSLVTEYNQGLNELLSLPLGDGTDIGGLSDAYEALINSYENASTGSADDTTLLNQLKTSYERYKNHVAIALNTASTSTERKLNGVDKVITEFTDSIVDQSNVLVASLNAMIDNLNAYKAIHSAAELIYGSKELKKAFLSQYISDETQLNDAVMLQMQDEISASAKSCYDNLIVETFIRQNTYTSLAQVEQDMATVLAELFENSNKALVKTQSWAANGPGECSVIVGADASSDDIACKYYLKGNDVWSNQQWVFSTNAEDTTTVDVNWEYTGFHAWHRAVVRISAFHYNSGVKNQQVVLEGNTRSGSGTASLTLNAGEAFGFIVEGSNFDSDNRLLGTLKLTFK